VRENPDQPLRLRISIEAPNADAARRILRELAQFDLVAGHQLTHQSKHGHAVAKIYEAHRSPGAELRHPCARCGAAAGARCRILGGPDKGAEAAHPHAGRDVG
jgi:hypothetical protein